MKTLGDVGAGHTLGRYELLVPIAQGGMAVVWAARMKGTRGFTKTVAVKCMLPALSDDPQFEEMFLAEAELAARIRHPHVCEILDLGEQDGLLYLVMEWIDGEPLSTLQKAARNKGGIPLSVAARLILNAATGLHAAHELKTESGELVGLVHRDVSPQNILVTYDGVVKIVDFGVAKATSAADAGHTKAGQVKGKIPFMSPEQALGKSVDRRTDIFALGIVLYQMITGRHPFRGENDMATLHKICEKVPVPATSSIIPECPAALSDAIAQALEKDVTKRFATMTEFARALEKALAELTSAGKDEDLGAFVRKTLGERAEKRRAAIKEALKVADERTKAGLTATGQNDRAPLSSASGDLSVASGINPPITGINSMAPPPPSASPSGAPSSPTGQSSAAFVMPPMYVPPAPKGGNAKLLAIGGAIVALFAIGGFFAFGRGAPRSAATPPAETSAAIVSASAVAPPPPVESATAVATAPSTAPSAAAVATDTTRKGALHAWTPPTPASAKPKAGAPPPPTDGPRVSNPGF